VAEKKVENKFMFCAGCKHNSKSSNDNPRIDCKTTNFESEED
jgi:hypothetical protein